MEAMCASKSSQAGYDLTAWCLLTLPVLAWQHYRKKERKRKRKRKRKRERERERERERVGRNLHANNFLSQATLAQEI